MGVMARLMEPSECGIIIDYFHRSTPEHLELLGVDPTRLPSAAAWRDRYEREFALPLGQRSSLLVIWLDDGGAFGFSTCDKITFGEQANMHLHVVEPERRQHGTGTDCVRQSVEIYFEQLNLKRLLCEPNAFNIAPNRTLQAAGFRYVKTHMTVPGPLNYRQAVTRWMIER